MANVPPPFLLLRRSLGLILASAATVATASCIGDSDQSLALPAGSESLAPSTKSDEPVARAPADTAVGRALERAFPAQADRVLGRLRGDGFVANEPGFARAPSGSIAAHVDVQLPHDAGGFARITAPGGFEVRVRELGAEGEAILADRAVTYRRAGGTSFWNATDGGAEEWLHLAAGTVASDDEVAAAWEVEGATLVAMNGAVALMDDGGVARAWATAPAAFGKDGRNVDVRLDVHGDRIELFADARGEEVLLDPGWVAAAPIVTGRYFATLTALASGKALLAGGYTGAALPTNAELYDPVANTWSSGGTNVAGRYFPSAVLLASGKVLVLGGQTFAGYVATTELYDPALNTWSATASMAAARGVSNATLLPNGKALVAGGYNGTAFLATAEQYDAGTNTWSSAGTLATARGNAVMVRLPSGKVLLAGGESGNAMAPTALATAELYDPASNTWSSAGTMAAGRYASQGALLANGKVLVIGGANAAGDAIVNADLYDPATNTWSATTALPASRAAHEVVLLGNAHVLAAGGLSGLAASLAVTQSSDAYDPATSTWTSAGNMSTVRYYASSVALAGGDALVVGGNNGSVVVANVDRYSAAPAVTGSTCGLGSQCATGFCVNGICCQVAACNALDQCHTVGTCQAGTGVCSNPAKANGAACTDGDLCTQTDNCQAGVCTGVNPVTCAAMDQCHDVGMCNPATGVCSQPSKMNGASCSDGNACTQSDTCMAGACVSGASVTCAALDQCHTAGSCDMATGVCSNPAKMDGLPCNDGNACTQTDVCMAGACTGANPVTCAAPDQCHTAGSCDMATGMCSNPAKMDGTACNDGSACTQTDVCMAGACTGANPVTCAAMDQCHDVGTCDAATGTCSNPAKKDGAACDDGNACTQADTCTAGACTGASPVTCMAQDECHEAGTCDMASGKCDNPAKPDGTACSKGTCQAGTCTGTTSGAGGASSSSSGSSSSESSGSGSSGSESSGSESSGSGTGGRGAGGGSGGPTDASGGCGCRVAGSEREDTAPGASLAGIAIAMLTWARRRRTARA